jgi:hypothetical protein
VWSDSRRYRSTALQSTLSCFAMLAFVNLSMSLFHSCFCQFFGLRRFYFVSHQPLRIRTTARMTAKEVRIYFRRVVKWLKHTMFSALARTSLLTESDCTASLAAPNSSCATGVLWATHVPKTSKKRTRNCGIAVILIFLDFLTGLHHLCITRERRVNAHRYGCLHLCTTAG